MTRPRASLSGEIVIETAIKRPSWFDASIGSKLQQDLIFFALPISRDQLANGLADHFVRGIAEHLFGTRIPGRDGAIESLANDCVKR